MSITISRSATEDRWVLKATKKGKQKAKRRVVPVERFQLAPSSEPDLQAIVATHVPVPAAPVKRKVKSKKERARKGRVTDKGYHRGRRPANKGKRYPATPLTPDEALRVMEMFRTSPCGRRDRALFVLLWRSGLRISEALDLKPDDIDWEQSAIFVRCGKGGKSRYSGIDSFGLAELRAWTDYRAKRGHGPNEYLFCIMEGPTKGGRLGAPAFRMVLAQTAKWAGIRKRVAPHQLRHAHACDLAREGVLLPHIQRQLGHANPGITGTYLSGLPTSEAITAVASRPSPLAAQHRVEGGAADLRQGGDLGLGHAGVDGPLGPGGDLVGRLRGADTVSDPLVAPGEKLLADLRSGVHAQECKALDIPPEVDVTYFTSDSIKWGGTAPTARPVTTEGGPR